MGARSDVISVMLVLAVLLGIVAVLPFGALNFSAVDSETIREEQPSAAFVELAIAEEAEAVRQAKMVWRNSARKWMRPDLLKENLPAVPNQPVLSIDERSRPQASAPVTADVPPFLPSMKAAHPQTIRVDKIVEPLPFPRNELLKLN